MGALPAMAPLTEDVIDLFLCLLLCSWSNSNKIKLVSLRVVTSANLEFDFFATLAHIKMKHHISSKKTLILSFFSHENIENPPSKYYSVLPKPPFWFRPYTETETQNFAVTLGRYQN